MQETVRQLRFRWLMRVRQEFDTALGDFVAPDVIKTPEWPL
jgi:hypothetical protein